MQWLLVDYDAMMTSKLYGFLKANEWIMHLKIEIILGNVLGFNPKKHARVYESNSTQWRK